MKRLPISVRTFSNLIKSDTLYVDKTEYLYNLVSNSDRYFLSRPRRFGKSLTCSTLDAIFSGNKKLFKNLWISKSDYDWQVRPVIYFDFNGVSHRTPEMLIRGLHNSLNSHAEKYRIILKNTDLKEKFSELVRILGKKINSVAIIIDEYDKPITSNIDNPKQAELLRIELEDFYGTLKTDDIDKNLHFLFITGVTKYSKISLFSELNHLNDLTNDNQTAALVGYTDEEVDLYLHEHIKAFADERKESYKTTRELLKTWYNGYRFSEKNVTVYNPFSLNSCLEKKRLDNFWATSGTSGFLIKFIEKNPNIASQIDSIDGSFYAKSELESFTPGFFYQKYKTLLLQSGYLTFLSGYNAEEGGYRIGYPNQEVRYSMTEQILEFVGEMEPIQFEKFANLFNKALASDDIELFCTHLQNFIKLIPHNIKVDREKFYQQVFFMICVLFGKRSVAEVATEEGFMDLLLEGTKNTYVVEFKRNSTPAIALAQIKKKRYWEAFKILESKKIVLAGITFNKTKKGVVVLCKTKELEKLQNKKKVTKKKIKKRTA